MNTMTKCLWAVLYLDAGMSASAAPPATPPPAATKVSAPDGTGAPPSALPGAAAERRPPPCRPAPRERTIWPNSSLLWGTRPTLQWGMRRKVEQEEMSSVLVSVDLGSLQLKGTQVKVEDGRLVSASPEGTSGRRTTLGSSALAGTILRGTASDGRPVDVAICAAEPATGDPSMMRYRIEFWNETIAKWESPCAGTEKKPAPWALAVQGVWDARGERQEMPGRFTFACEEGVIAKCISWGYKPWQTQGGQSLKDYHQACTRMARADYCGNGQSHTIPGVQVDIYDTAQVQRPEASETSGRAPAPMSFEAAWGTDGAYCVAHTRDGQELKAIQDECPGRWEMAEEDLGNGDRCVLRKKGAAKDAVLMRARSHEQRRQAEKTDVY